MKRLIPAIVAAIVLAGAAQAQTINLGPGGIGIDTRSPRDRAIDREIRREERFRERERERRAERRAERRFERRGERCRTVTTREETRRGVIRRTTRICD